MTLNKLSAPSNMQKGVIIFITNSFNADTTRVQIINTIPQIKARLDL